MLSLCLFENTAFSKKNHRGSFDRLVKRKPITKIQVYIHHFRKTAVSHGLQYAPGLVFLSPHFVIIFDRLVKRKPLKFQVCIHDFKNKPWCPTGSIVYFCSLVSFLSTHFVDNGSDNLISYKSFKHFQNLICILQNSISCLRKRKSHAYDMYMILQQAGNNIVHE